MGDERAMPVRLRPLKGMLANLTLIAALLAPIGTATAVDGSPFAAFPGRWVGEGMLGLKESPPEKVKCRATYFLIEGKDEMKQNIRCATSGGGVEIQSAIENISGALTGTWRETTRNIGGELSGQVTPRGLRISVKGEDISANMEIVLRETKQVIEIQFINSSLVGLSLIMNKG